MRITRIGADNVASGGGGVSTPSVRKVLWEGKAVEPITYQMDPSVNIKDYDYLIIRVCIMSTSNVVSDRISDGDKIVMTEGILYDDTTPISCCGYGNRYTNILFKSGNSFNINASVEHFVTKIVGIKLH